jgi:hypothetical protein
MVQEPVGTFIISNDLCIMSGTREAIIFIVFLKKELTKSTFRKLVPLLINIWT